MAPRDLERTAVKSALRRKVAYRRFHIREVAALAAR
jgi:hypothetical protein